MSTTGVPDEAAGGPGIVWSKGSGNGGNWSLKRVTTEDKITVSDINQLRNLVEQLYNHTHEYVDNASSSSSCTLDIGF